MNNIKKSESFCKGRRSKFRIFQNQNNYQCSQNNQQPSVLFTNIQRNDIALHIRNYYYDNNDFWNVSQKLGGFVREWTSEQVDQIFYDLMKEFFSTKPINEWGDQIQHRIVGTTIAIPLILDNTPDHPSKAEIARKSGFREYSSAIEGLVKLLRPDDYKEHFTYTGHRNPAKRSDVRKKISENRLRKVKIDDIRNAIGNYIFSELKNNGNRISTLDQIKKEVNNNRYLGILKKVKFSSYINEKIKQTIKVVYLLINPYFTEKSGISQVQIKEITDLDATSIRNLSLNLEKEFSEIYSHKQRFSLEFTEITSGKRRSSDGRLISDVQIKFDVCSYIFSKLSQNWNQTLNFEKLIAEINLNPYLKIMRGIEITEYLEKQLKKYLIAVPLMMEPYFVESNNKKVLTIEDIHQISRLDHRQIRQISTNFEKTFGENIYNDLERFPIPQNELKDVIKGYPREFYDPKLRREIRLSQTVIISGDKLIQSEKGVFRDLLTGDSIDKNESRDLHHLSYNKNDNRRENLGFLKSEIHNKISANQFNKKIADYFKNVLNNNKIALKRGIVPKTWKDKQKSFLNYIDCDQSDLNEWL